MIAILIIILSYVLSVIYVKKKMLGESSQILEEIKGKVDKVNLENLVKLSDKKQNPDSYNSNIAKYEEEAAIYAGRRALESPKEVFSDLFEFLKKLLTF
jgi:hypothetical protein